MGIWAIRKYLYVIWNMLKSADLHETILTSVICHKHVRYHDGVTLYFSVKEDEKWIFLIDVSTFPLSEVKAIKKKKFDWTLVNNENVRV